MKRVLQIFRDGHKSNRYLSEPLREGEQGNLQTLDAMAEIVRADRTQPDLRTFVLREIVGPSVAGHDHAGEINKIFAFAQSGITYRKDPFGVERVADIWSTLYALNPNEPEGDCGIKSVFFASCCAILGHKPFFVVVKQSKSQWAFNHVYNAVLLNGEIQYFDATPQDAPAGWQVPAEQRFIYQIF